MKYLSLLLMGLLSVGCLPEKNKQKSFAEVDYLITKEWMYAQSVAHIKNEGAVIKRPPGVEILVLGLTIAEEGGLSLKNHCVYYHVPYKDSAGSLKITEVKKLQACPENADDQAWVLLSGLQDLSISMKDFRLTLNFSMDRQKRSIEVFLPNVELGLVHEKYSSLKEKRLYDGMKLLRLTDDSFDSSTNRHLGKLTDRFGHGTAIRCHKVDKNCQDVGENRCDDCRYGWYEVVDYQCPQGGSKFCGQNHCGEKNEPACPRGIKVISLEENGICQNDLEPVENADKVLVCQ